MRVEVFTFVIAGAICLGGALGVVLLRNTVHCALSLVATLFGVAVLFLAQEAWFLAAIQVIVYAGAIVVLFLFVIMLLGVDRAEATERDPLPAQRIVGAIVGAAVLVTSVVLLLAGGGKATGATASAGSGSAPLSDIDRIGRVLFTDNVYAFEITAVLLTVAVVGAVVLSRRPPGPPIDDVEFPDGPAVEHLPLYPEPSDELDGDGETEPDLDELDGGSDGDASGAAEVDPSRPTLDAEVTS